jgi:DNA-binding beta-propeller fold protein YncE
VSLFAAVALAFSVAAQAQTQFTVDATWPGPLPDKWITGQVGGVCVDGHDHIVIVNRRDITDEERETGLQAPPILMFDVNGALVRSFGNPATVPTSIHGCAFDAQHNVYVAGNNDGLVQKYSHEGQLLLQIGTKGVVDTSDGTPTGTLQNAAKDRLFSPSGMAIDPTSGDIYVSDGYGNRRIAVFDKNGTFLRQWGRQATKDEIATGVGGAFAQVIHCVAISAAGLVYVCDRQGDRIQVFDKMGTFKRNIWVRTGTPELPDARGTAWWVAFSRDPRQQYLYLMNGRNETVHVLDHESGKILNTFGRPGHQAGQFTHGHTLALDSRGNLYVAETNWGRRVQRFVPASK